jgi:hypothetical protein
MSSPNSSENLYPHTGSLPPTKETMPKDTTIEYMREKINDKVKEWSQNMAYHDRQDRSKSEASDLGVETGNIKGTKIPRVMQAARLEGKDEEVTQGKEGLKSTPDRENEGGTV